MLYDAHKGYHREMPRCSIYRLQPRRAPEEVSPTSRAASLRHGKAACGSGSLGRSPHRPPSSEPSLQSGFLSHSLVISTQRLLLSHRWLGARHLMRDTAAARHKAKVGAVARRVRASPPQFAYQAVSRLCQSNPRYVAFGEEWFRRGLQQSSAETQPRRF